MKDDMISRQAAINKLNERQRKLIYCFGFENDMVKIMDIAKSIINAMPSAQPEQRWTPVTERLPKSNMDVLVTDGEDCAVAYWRTDAQAWDDSMHGWCDLYGLDVIAWQPLPKPYKEDKK